MAKINFYLRDKSVRNESQILVSFHYDGNRLKMATECRIPAEYWSENKQRAKEIMEFPEGADINDQLDKIEETVKSLHKKYRNLGYFPYPSEFRKEYLKLDGVPIKDKKAKTFWDFFDEFVEFKKKLLTDVRDYDKSLRKHLVNLEEKLDRKISFSMISDIENTFADDWMGYLQFEAINSEGDPGLTTNTVGKQNKNLKVFLNWCFDRNIISRFSTKRFPTVTADVDKVYVTEEEIKKILNADLKIEQQKTVRDLFVIGCETGLRFSDFTRIDSDWIRNNQLQVRPQKTMKHDNNKIIIPISERFQKILDKHNNIPPSFNGSQVTLFNTVLREVCKEAKLVTPIIRYRLKGGKEVKEVKQKYEEISSHTCRRTFCTLKFLKGMPAQAIMKFSGHKTERNFLKYLKLDAELTASKYSDYF